LGCFLYDARDNNETYIGKKSPKKRGENLL